MQMRGPSLDVIPQFSVAHRLDLRHHSPRYCSTAAGPRRPSLSGELAQEVALTRTSRLMPFLALPDSSMKKRISERAKRCYDGSVWMTQSYYDAPLVAFVEEIPDFPYIGTDGACFEIMNQLVWEAHELWVLIQAASVGHPLAVACWFEYADRDLEYSEWENTFSWLLPAIPPLVKRCSPVDIVAIQANITNYFALSPNRRSTLLRSMERFRQSQSRREAIDRVLDLALAFEIAVSDKGDNAPPGWKVSVRSTQLIGGPLKERQQNRATTSTLYELRNQATHGSTLKAKSSKKSVDEILGDNAGLFVQLMKRLLALRLKPDWKAVELEPSGATQMELDDVEIGQKYRCDYKGAQYFATVVSKDNKDVCVTLGDIVSEDGDPGDPTEALGTLGEIRVSPAHLHPM
jgi:Apea-like HEPN